MKNDSHRQMALMMAGTKAKAIYGNTLGTINPYLEWLKWLSYTPEFEKNRMEELKNKPINMLSVSELDELINLLSQERIGKLFSLYGTIQISKDDYMEVYDYMCEKSIDKLMLSKLSKEELKYATKAIKKYEKLPYDKLSAKINRETKENVYESLSMVDSYILHAISIFSIQKSISDMDGKLASRVEENNAISQKSYYYSLNPYRRY